MLLIYIARIHNSGPLIKSWTETPKTGILVTHWAIELPDGAYITTPQNDRTNHSINLNTNKRRMTDVTVAVLSSMVFLCVCLTPLKLGHAPSLDSRYPIQPAMLGHTSKLVP